MEYIGYCYNFHLYARHSIRINGSSGESHPHIWQISVFVEARGDFSEFDQTEKIIQRVLEQYENRNLNDVQPFDQVNPILENIGEVFFLKFNQVLQEYGIEIKKLEISETPVRIYVVDQKTLSSQNKNAVSDVMLTAFLNGRMNYAADSFSNTAQVMHEEKLSCADADRDKKQGENENLQMQAVEISSPVIPEQENKHTGILPKCAFAVLWIVICTGLLVYYVNLRGYYPWGSDTYGHIFKADLLYRNIKMGNYYPLYTAFWYNGIQPFRYWAPVPYYIMAAFQFLSKGDPIIAYNLFMAFCFMFGAFGWLLWGIKEKRIFLSMVIGILWFCMPDNIRVFFSEGNIPRVTIAVILPYLLYFIWQFVEYRKKYALIAVILLMALTCLSHLMIAAMIGITVFIFMLYYGIANKALGRPLQAILGMLLAISLCGVWLYPALQGGLMSIDSEAVSEVMKSLTFPFTQTLNPMLRFRNIEIYYFGLSFMVISAAGLFLSNRKSKAGFLTLITIFLGTTTAFVPILIKLPLNQLLWMMRFTPVAYAVFAMGIILWKNIRRYVLIIVLLLVMIDSGFSFRLLAFNSSPPPDTMRMLDEARAAANQRIAILDGSEFGSFPSYYLCTGESPVPYAYGWAWQGASTAQNIVLLNTALEKEYYTFMFDRCLEAGCDTVLVKKDKVRDFNKLNSSAGRNRYEFVKEFNNGYLYKMSTPKSFGLTTKYYGLAVGKSAANIVMEFPGFEIGKNNGLDSYTLDELLQYEVVYISGFDYKDKKTAEKLVLDAAERGVKFVIDMNRVPNEPITNRLTFLGVTAQPIQFENKLPDLHFSGVAYFPATFKEENKKWNTVYLEGVPNPRGFSWFGGNKLVFLGEHQNTNITLIGFNLLYHGIVNEDSKIVDIFGTVMGKMKDTLPDRKIVPVQFTFQSDLIKIKTERENVNTTLANLDAFTADAETDQKHNFLLVKQPVTELKITYPYWKEGLAVSGIGLIATLVFLYFVFKSRGEKYESDQSSLTNTIGFGGTAS